MVGSAPVTVLKAKRITCWCCPCAATRGLRRFAARGEHQPPKQSPCPDGGSRMRKDTRPVLLASSLPAVDVECHPGEKTSIVCPDCRTWRMVAEGRIFPHPGRDGKRCDASARRFALDVRPATPAQRR